MLQMAPKSAIWIGCIVGIVSSATQSVGITLQRKSHIIENTKPRHLPYKPAYQRSLWRLGFLLFLLSNIFGSSVQITTLPLIILSPLQAVGLVFNSICACLILNEPFTTNLIMGTCLVAGGALLIAFYGSIPEPTYSLKELLFLMKRTPFVVWFCLTFMVVIGLLMWILLSKNHYHKNAISDISEPQTQSKLEYLRNSVFSVDPHQAYFVQGLLFGVISGILSAHSLLLAKSAVELVTRAFLLSDYSDLKQFQTWLILVIFVTVALTQVYFLNCGLKRASTSVLYPLIFCVYNITNIFNGLIYFNQFSSLSHFTAFWIFIGTSLVLSGVFTLSCTDILKGPQIHLNTGNVGMDAKSVISETTSLISNVSDHSSSPSKKIRKKKTYLLNNEETNIVYVGNEEGEESQFVSFGSPRNSPVIMQDTTLNDESMAPNPLSPISPFRYSSLNYDLEYGEHAEIAGHRKITNGRRMLSFEQSELLSQLKIGSFSERE